MNKHDFNLEAAKAGAPIQFSSGSMDGSSPHKWEDVYFIGVNVNGSPVIQHNNGSLTTTSALRMKPREPMSLAQLATMFGIECGLNSYILPKEVTGHDNSIRAALTKARAYETADEAICAMHEATLELIWRVKSWHEQRKNEISKSGREDSFAMLSHEECIKDLNAFLNIKRAPTPIFHAIITTKI